MKPELSNDFTHISLSKGRNRMRDPHYPAIDTLMRLRWMHLRDFLDMADEEDASVYTDLLELKEAYLSEPLPPGVYQTVLESAQELGLRQAMFVTAGSVYTEKGFVAASRMLVFGASVDLLRGHGLSLSTICWPHSAPVQHLEEA